MGAAGPIDNRAAGVYPCGTDPRGFLLIIKYC